MMRARVGSLGRRRGRRERRLDRAGGRGDRAAWSARCSCARYERSERIYAAMQARGFDGDAPPPARARATRRSVAFGVPSRRSSGSSSRPTCWSPRCDGPAGATSTARPRRRDCHDHAHDHDDAGHRAGARSTPTRGGSSSSTSTSPTPTASRRCAASTCAIAPRREGRAGRPERRRQEHADAPPQRHPPAAHGSVRIGGHGRRPRDGPARPRRGRPRLPGPRRPAVQPDRLRRRRLRAAPHGRARRPRSTTASSGRWPRSGWPASSDGCRTACRSASASASRWRPCCRWTRSVLVFDEPSAGLDPRGRRELIGLLRGAAADDARVDPRHAPGRRGLPAHRRRWTAAASWPTARPTRSSPTTRSSRRTGSSGRSE